jgi:hypothetical protein
MPIYFVIVEGDYAFNHYSVYNILKCIACDMDDYDTIYLKEFAPLMHTGVHTRAMIMIFRREPANPFKELTMLDAIEIPKGTPERNILEEIDIIPGQQERSVWEL